MKSKKDKSLPTADTALRRQAEERLQAKTAIFHSPRTEEEAQRLVHELEVHQIELEMQNAELRQARDEIERVLDKYTDLYDLAPVGYFTLDRDGTVRDSNLTGASLLGIERARLIGLRLGQIVNAADRPVFTEFLRKVFENQNKDACEVRLLHKPLPLYIQIEAVAAASGQECRVAAIDITARKQAEEHIHKYIAELDVVNKELNRFNSAAVGRELRMIELKKEINELCVHSGKPPRYPLDFEKE